MQLEPCNSYHIYNQGNNKQHIFFEKENYLFFLRKMRCHILPFTTLMAYCLMPNHFHWFLYLNAKRFKNDKITTKPRSNLLTKNIATLLSSYTQAINNRYNRTGSLFRNKTKVVKVDTQNYGITCLHYIHQNPLRAGLVSRLGDWPFSSLPDYLDNRNGTLINKIFTFKYLDINPLTFEETSERAIDPKNIKNLL